MVGWEHCLYVIEWDGFSSEAYKVEKLFCLEKKFEYHGLGGVKCDPTGRLYVGTRNARFCDPKQPFDCALYSYDKHRGLQKVATGFKVSDGMAWSPNGNCLYHIDDCTFDIKQYKWNSHTGELCE